jgi:hypothetical protein
MCGDNNSIACGANCFQTDLPEGSSGRRPGASVVSSASMSVLHSSSLRDYSPASRSANQDSLQVVSLAAGHHAMPPLLCLVVSFAGFLFLLSVVEVLFQWSIGYRGVLVLKIYKARRKL